MNQVRSFSKDGKQINYYDELELDWSATNDDIKGAYYKLSKVHHPDKNKGCKKAATKFRDLTEAYETLSNERLRKLYDRALGELSR